MYFFHCVLAKLAWCCFRSWLQVSWAPSSFSELRVVANDLTGVTKRLLWVGLEGDLLGLVDYQEQIYHRACFSC